MNRVQYPVLLTPAEEGGYVVTCRDLPELVTRTVEDALEQAADAMDEVFATYFGGRLSAGAESIGLPAG